MRLLSALFICSTALGLSACDPTTGLHFNPDVNYNIASGSYTATDRLIMQAGTTLPKNTPLLVGTIADANNLETSSPLGRTVAEQVAARLVQKGYTVTDVRFRNAINVKQDSRDETQAGEFFLSRDLSVISTQQDVGAVVTGTYVDGADDVLVNLRLIAATTGQIISATDFRMPKTSDVRALTGGDEAFFKPGPYARDYNF